MARLCGILTERLKDALCRRDIWLENSDRWGDPRRKLLQGKEWQAQCVAVCRASNEDSWLILI